MNDVTSNKNNFLLFFKCVILFLIASCVVGAFLVSTNEREFLIAILGVICLVIVSFPMFTQRNVELFEPLTFIVLLVVIGIPVKLIYVLWIRRTDQFVVDHVLLNQEPDVFMPGIFWVVITFFLLVVGYSFRFPKPPLSFLYMPQVKDINAKRLQIAMLIFVAISLTGFLLFIASAGVSLSSLTSLSQKRFLESRAEGGERMHDVLYIFVRMSGFSKFVVYFGLIWLIKRKKSFASYTGLLVTIAIVQTIVLAFMLNSRAGVALLLLDCCIISYFLMNRIDPRIMLGAFFVATFLMMIMLAARLQTAKQDSSPPLAGLIQTTLCGRNMLDIAKICHIINGVPKEMDYRNGEMLYNWIAGPIPMSYWPDKPKWATQGIVVNQKIFKYRGAISGCPPGIMGELYWNFGLSGMLIGMFIAGIVYKQMFVMFYPHRNSPAAILIYTMVFTRFFLFTIANDLGTGIVKSGLDLIPTYITFLLIGMRTDGGPSPD